MKKSVLIGIIVGAVVLISIVFGVVFSMPANNDGSTTTTTKRPTLTVEDIVGSAGVYCLHADGTVTKADKLSKIEKDSAIYSGGAPLVVDRSKGDKLIYVGDLVYLGASSKGKFEMDWYAEQYYWSGKKVDLMGIDMFEGADLEGEVKESGIFYWMNVDDFFEPLGYTFFMDMTNKKTGYILSKSPKTYSYGYFKGTKWNETTDTNNSYFYDVTKYDFTKDYVFRADVISGKDGYFTIDLEGIEGGIYLNEFDEKGHIYAIEIK